MRRHFRTKDISNMWWLWLVVALIAVIIEVSASGLVFIGLAMAALAAAIVGVFIPSFFIEAAVFAATSGAYVALLRPAVLRLVSGQHLSLPGANSPGHQIVGKRAIVTHEVTDTSGQIRVGNGEFWSAKPFTPDDVIPVGARVEILLVDGLTAMVTPVPVVQALTSAQSSSG